MYKINLIYFKSSGKYYETSSFQTNKAYMFEVFDQVKELKAAAKLPGLISGDWDGPILVNSDDHPNAYPGLIL